MPVVAPILPLVLMCLPDKARHRHPRRSWTTAQPQCRM